MNRFWLVVIVFILFVAIVFGGMTLFARTAESTIISDRSCQPPCWLRIQPGRTSVSEAVSILEREDIEIMPWADLSENGKIGWMFHFPNKDSAGYIYFIDGKVGAISIQTTGSLTLTEAFKKLGVPDYYWTRFEKIDGQDWLEVFFMYPQDGFIVKVSYNISLLAESDAVDILGDQPVDRVVYFDPAMYDTILRARILFNEDRETIIEGLEPWQGFGEISY